MNIPPPFRLNIGTTMVTLNPARREVPISVPSGMDVATKFITGLELVFYDNGLKLGELFLDAVQVEELKGALDLAFYAMVAELAVMNMMVYDFHSPLDQANDVSSRLRPWLNDQFIAVGLPDNLRERGDRDADTEEGEQ